jgi:DivIVA domain-containing protein
MDARRQQLIDRIRKAEFRTIRFSPGYDELEVDDLLDQIVQLLRDGHLPDPGELRSVRFSRSRLRPGYVQEDVDRLLQEIAEASASF